MDTAAILFFLAFMIAVMLGCTAFFFANLRTDHHIRVNLHREDLEDRAARRHVLLTRLNPDPNGNMPVYFREDTLEFIAPPPGNSPYPNQIFFQPGSGSQQPKISVLKPPTTNEIRINAWNAHRVNGEVDNTDLERLNAAPERSELPEPPFERSFEPVNGLNDLNAERSDLDFRDILWKAKRKGEGKQKAIEQNIPGVTKGGSKDWQYWSTVWDSME